MIDKDSVIATVITVIVAFSLIIIVPTFITHLLKQLSQKILFRHKKYESVTLAKTNFNSSDRYKYSGNCYYANGKYINWTTVFLSMSVLFPVGIYYLIRKLSYEKMRYLSNGIILTIVGSAFVIITAPIVALIITAAYGNLRDILLLTAFPGTYMLTGLSMIITGIVLKQKGITNETYMTLVTEYEVTNLDSLRTELNTTYSDVTDRLMKLIDIDLLPDSYIYHKDREIIVPGISKKVAIKCNICMGTTVLYSNEEQICTYCGGKL